MVHIDTIDLSQRGVELPADLVGMVLAQPCLTLTPAEPYRCADQSKQQQLQVITDTLAVALAATHGAPKTHFTVFPEYSIPGPDGINEIERVLAGPEWPSGTIIIGGTDALSKAQFAALAEAQGSHLDAANNTLARIGETEWVNCGLTWIKAADGTVERWLQPKLSPAWLEQNISCQSMFRGNSIYMFRGQLSNGTQFRFCTLICFDWIAAIGGEKSWRWAIADVAHQATAAQAELPLSWFFVIQCNPKPSHDSFLTQVSGFFDQTHYPNVRRDRACLIFANCAGKEVPGKSDLYGSSSLVFSGQTLFSKPECHPTFSTGGQRFRSSTLLQAYHDVVFRERGACIHSFSQVNPSSLTAGADGRTIALRQAFVYPLNGTLDPRVPSQPVPACVKWLNDEVDNIQSLSQQYTTPVADSVDAAHARHVAALRSLTPQDSTQFLALASPNCLITNSGDPAERIRSADEWETAESEALEHVMNVLDIIGTGFPDTAVATKGAHGSAIVSGLPVDLLAIRGNTHEACREHSRRFVPLPRRNVLLISRDPDNTAWRAEFGSFLEPGSPHLVEEHKFTDPTSGWLHLGYERLLSIFRSADTLARIRGLINAELI